MEPGIRVRGRADRERARIASRRSALAGTRASADRSAVRASCSRSTAAEHAKALSTVCRRALTRENLNKLVRREMPLKPSPFPARWVSVRTGPDSFAPSPLRSIGRAADTSAACPLTKSPMRSPLRLASEVRWPNISTARSSILRTAGSTTGTCGSCRSLSLKGSRARRPPSGFPDSQIRVNNSRPTDGQ